MFLFFLARFNLRAKFSNEDKNEIDDDFDVIVNEYDSNDNLKIFQNENHKILLNVADNIKKTFSILDENDYLFNYLSIFYNPIKKNIYNKPSFNFDEELNFDKIKKELKNHKFEAFIIYKKDLIKKKNLDFNYISNIEESLYDMDFEKPLSFTHYYILGRICCIDQEFFKMIQLKAKKTCVKSLLKHEIQHLIKGETNENNGNKFCSPKIKGVHLSEEGESGDLFEFLVTVKF